MLFGSLLKWGRQPSGSQADYLIGDDGPGAAAYRAAPDAARNSPEQMLRDRRYAALLEPDSSEPLDDEFLFRSWDALAEDMVLIPPGQIALGPESSDLSGVRSAANQGPTVTVNAFYLDRHTVTNREFARFVAAGCYDQMGLWPEEIWPSVVQFVDQTGAAGPHSWSQGRMPRGRENHPVVGICWYEAAAYARWMGKRLPTSAEWEKAGSWPADLSGRGPKVRYPWGNAYDPKRANLWTSGIGSTVPVDQYVGGCTPNGISQLVGNVWEWVEDRYTGPDVPEGLRVHLDQAMGEIRGGAFDTYFEIQATTQFRSGLPLLARPANVGFRCAVSVDRLRPRP